VITTRAAGSDPTLADSFNIRVELWRKKGDLPSRLAYFRRRYQTQPGFTRRRRAITNPLARNWSVSAALMAVNKKPSFNCATARRAVERRLRHPELCHSRPRDPHRGAHQGGPWMRASDSALCRPRLLSAIRPFLPARMPLLSGRDTICTRK